MSRQAELCAVGLALVAAGGCGDGTDWRIAPCPDETDETCGVGSLVVGERERTYVVSRRNGYDCSAGDLPLILAWHGSGGNGASFRANMNDDFEDLDFEATVAGRALVVYPDGIEHGDCRGRTCWDREPDGYDTAFFDALVAQLADDYCVDTSRVFSVGHSRGGRFVEVLACHRSDSHVAVASISAGDGNVEACPGNVPIWLTHAHDDATIGFDQGENHRDAWAERNGCDAIADPATFPDDACTTLSGCGDTPVVWCPTNEPEWDGHAIPEIADEEIWAFFSSLP